MKKTINHHMRKFELVSHDYPEDELSMVNGEHAVLTQQLAYINNLIYRIKEGNDNEKDDQTSHAES